MRINKFSLLVYCSILFMPIQVSKLFILFDKSLIESTIFIENALALKILYSLTLFDILIPIALVFVLYNIYRNKIKFRYSKIVLISVTPFVLAHVLIIFFYQGRLDLYYSLSYIYGVLILLFFYILSDALVEIDKKLVYLFFPLVILPPMFSYLLYGSELIFWDDSFYHGFSSILTNRLELMSRGPAWLASYMMFILYIFIVWIREKEIQNKEIYVGLLLIFLIALLTRSRDIALILCIIAFYLYKRSGVLDGKVVAISSGAILLVTLSISSLFVNIFPISDKSPYVNMEEGQYKLIQKAHLNYIMDNDVIFGDGYSAARYAEINYRNEDQMRRMLNEYGLDKNKITAYMKGSRGPHNSYLRLIEGGGIILLSFFLFIFYYPIRNRIYLYKFFLWPAIFLTISGLYSEIINYRWFWASAGIYMYLVLRDINKN